MAGDGADGSGEQHGAAEGSLSNASEEGVAAPAATSLDRFLLMLAADDTKKVRIRHVLQYVFVPI